MGDQKLPETGKHNICEMKQNIQTDYITVQYMIKNAVLGTKCTTIYCTEMQKEK